VIAGQSFRTRSLTTKVTEEEYVQLQELVTAAGQSMGEWARTVLLAVVMNEPVKVKGVGPGICTL